jgi:exodeoxyribonuclease VII large subunit
LLSQLTDVFDALQNLIHHQLDRQAQRLDHVQNRLGRPSQGTAHQKMQLLRLYQRMRQSLHQRLQGDRNNWATLNSSLTRGVQQIPALARERIQRAAMRLELLDPKLVLQRGFAWLADQNGAAITSVKQAHDGQSLRATLADGVVDLRVTQAPQN